jgi:protein O-GlcNAc transferase
VASSRLIQSGCVLLIIAAARAQEPSPALKQADASYRAGQAALSQQNYEAAQADFEQVVRLAPALEQGYSSLGAVLMARGHIKDAIPILVKALAIQKTDTTAQMNLAIAYQQVGLPAKALSLFAALDASARTQHRPLPPGVLAAYARALATAGELKQAAAKMRAASDEQPQDAGLHDDLGSVLAQQKNWPEAAQQFTKALELEPSLARAHLHLGAALDAQGLDGSDQFEQAAQLAPNDPSIALETGKALAMAGHDEQAMAQFQRVLALHPPDNVGTQAMYEQALALQRTNHVQEATDLLRKVVAAQPENAGALINLGMALSQAQQNKEAVPVLERAITLKPNAPVAHQDLASAYVQLNQLDDAARELRAAIKLAPDSSQLHYDLGLALKMQDHADDAIPEFAAAERLDPASPEAPYALGTLYMQTAHYPEAAREIKRSLDLRPTNGEGWATLGSVYSKLDRLPEAADALQEATRQLPDQADPHLTLAAVLVKQGHPEEAVLERRKAAELMRANMNRQRAEVATNAGNGLLKNGDLAGAAERFRDALSYDSTYSEAHLGMAKLLEAQGKMVEAAAERAAAASK